MSEAITGIVLIYCLRIGWAEQLVSQLCCTMWQILNQESKADVKVWENISELLMKLSLSFQFIAAFFL